MHKSNSRPFRCLLKGSEKADFLKTPVLDSVISILWKISSLYVQKKKNKKKNLRRQMICEEFYPQTY